MVKFFKREDKKCTMCGNPFTEDNPCKQHLRGPLIGKQYICKTCFEDTYAKVEPQVMQNVLNAKKTGQTINLDHTRKISDEITKRIINKD
jgi:hypothetical protein